MEKTNFDNDWGLPTEMLCAYRLRSTRESLDCHWPVRTRRRVSKGQRHKHSVKQFPGGRTLAVAPLQLWGLSFLTQGPGKYCPGLFFGSTDQARHKGLRAYVKEEK